MSAAREIIERELLKLEKRRFLVGLLLWAAAYVGLTLLLNAIRQQAPIWIVWTLIILQFFALISVFVFGLIRMRQCGFSRWWLWISFFLSRIENWEVVVLPATISAILFLSHRCSCVSAETAHLIPNEEEDGEEQNPTLDQMRQKRDRLKRKLDLLEDPNTICQFGEMAYDGDGTEQDYAEAASWFRIAGEQGHARAQHNLALMLEEGIGLERNLDEAVHWYRLAAEQGNSGSQNNLGALYEQGLGVPRNLRTALDWYRKAAAGGDLNAKDNVLRINALIYSQGAESGPRE